VELPWMPGGFVGVDVFFVISGYLISSMIQHEVLRGTFSWKWFIARRVRRIIPALYIVVAATLVAGTFLYLPERLTNLSTTALYSVALLQNVYFYMEANYFAAPPDFNALIHLWSLGVEEQFYLVFPPLFGMLLFLRGKGVSRPCSSR
jgi:peptidoglycan/LPS O-acetylase OafA/YrhL